MDILVPEIKTRRIHGRANPTLDNAAWTKLVAECNAFGRGVDIEVTGQLHLTSLATIAVDGSLTCKGGGAIVPVAAGATIGIGNLNNPWNMPASARGTMSPMAKGSTRFTKISGPTLSQGDYVVIWSDDEYTSPYTPHTQISGGRPIQLVQLAKPTRQAGGGYDAVNFDLEGSVFDDFLTAPNFVKIDPRSFTVDGAVFTHSGTDPANTPLRMQYSINSRIVNNRLKAPAPGHFLTLLCMNPHVSGNICETKYSADDSSQLAGQGYSLTDAASSNPKFFGNDFKFCRHGFTTGGVEYNIASRGAYSAGTTYIRGDVVTQAGADYVAKFLTAGNAPPNTSFWDAVTAWNSSTNYVRGAVVSSGGNHWLAIRNNINVQPPATTVASSVTPGGPWVRNVRYGGPPGGKVFNNTFNWNIENVTGGGIASHPPLDTHGDTIGWEFFDNTFFMENTAGATTSVISMRGRECLIRNNRIFCRSQERGVSVFGPRNQVIGNKMWGGWTLVDVRDLGLAGNNDATIATDNEAYGITGPVFGSKIGSNHVVERNKGVGVGSSTFFYGSACGIAIQAGTGHRVNDNEIPKASNQYLFDFLTASDVAGIAECRGNKSFGYGCTMGINRGALSAQQIGADNLEITWHHTTIKEFESVVVAATSHGLDLVLDMYKPIGYDNAIWTSNDSSPLAGLLLSGTANTLCLAPPGASVVLPDSKLQGSFNISSDGRKLKWNGTKFDKNGASAPVLMVRSQAGSNLGVTVLDGTADALAPSVGETITKTGHGVPVAAVGAMLPIAINYVRGTNTFTRINGTVSASAGTFNFYILGAPDADTLVILPVADSPRVRIPVSVAATLDATYFANTTGNASTTPSFARMFQVTSTGVLTLYHDILASSGGGGAPAGFAISTFTLTLPNQATIALPDAWLTDEVMVWFRNGAVIANNTQFTIVGSTLAFTTEISSGNEVGEDVLILHKV